MRLKRGSNMCGIGRDITIVECHLRDNNPHPPSSVSPLLPNPQNELNVIPPLSPATPAITPAPEIPVAPVITPAPVVPVAPVITPAPDGPVAPVITPAPDVPVAPAMTPAPFVPIAPVYTPAPVAPAPAAPVINSVTQVPPLSQRPKTSRRKRFRRV